LRADEILKKLGLSDKKEVKIGQLSG